MMNNYYCTFCKILIVLQSATLIKALTLFQPILSGSREIQFTRLDGMCRGNNVPITINFKGLKQEGSIFFINATLIAKEDITEQHVETIKLTRCASQENLDSCSNYKEFKLNYCDMKNHPFHFSYVPEWKCPLKKGTYTALNSKLNFSSVLAMVPPQKWFWKSDGELRDKNGRLLLCTILEAVTRAKL